MESRIPVASNPLDYTRDVDRSVLIGENTSESSNAIDFQIGQEKLSKQEAGFITENNSWKQRTLEIVNRVK